MRERLWHKLYKDNVHVCTERRCRLPRTILSRSRPDPRNDFVVFTDEIFLDLFGFD